MTKRLNRSLSMKTIAIALLALMAVMSSERAQAGCTRHFYNKSNTWWIVAMPLTGSCKVNRGACVAPPDERWICDTSQRTVCGVAPGETAQLNYNDQGDVIIMTRGTGFNQSFPANGSCYLSHNGSTGNVALNDPANGDIVTCGGPGYPCR